jgi:integrase
LRLRKGGAASRYAEVSREDFARRYGAFLGFLQRSGLLDPSAGPAAQVTPQNVELYIAELKARVRSVTVWNCIYKLRMAARLLDPEADFAWLSDIEQDLALVMEPRSKFDRVVLAERLVQAGLTLVREAEAISKYPFERAIGIRNGLIIALLAVCPIRIKNYAALQIGTTFKEEQGNWWITLPYGSTKTEDADQRPVPDYLNDAVELYLAESRPVLIGSRPATNALWISSRTGRRYTTKNLGTQISKITVETIGVDVSPHLFRTAARRNDGDMIAEHGKIVDALGLGSHQRQRGRRSRSLEPDGEKHDVLLGIEASQFQRVGWRIHDADVHPAGFVLERAALGPRNAHHVAEGGEDYVGLLRNGQAIVNAPHGKHADRTAGPVDQFDILRKDVLEAEAIDGVRVTTADFHQAVVPVAAGQAADFLGCS